MLFLWHLLCHILVIQLYYYKEKATTIDAHLEEKVCPNVSISLPYT